MPNAPAKSVFSPVDEDGAPPSIWAGGDIPPATAPAAPAQAPDAAPAPVAQPSPAQGATPPVFSPLDDQESAVHGKLQKLYQQDATPWGSPTNHPGTLGKIAHGLSVAGQIAGSIFAPHVLANIEGTEANRSLKEQQLAGQEQELEKEKVGNAKEQAETENLNAQPELKQKSAEIKQLEDQEKNRHNLATEGLGQDKLGADISKHGLMRDANGNLVENPDSPYMHEQQAKIAVQHANEEYTQAKAAYENMKGDPNSLPNQQIRQRMAFASGNLVLRQKEYMMHALGTDGNGNALNGSFIGDNGQSIGTALQGNVKPTSTQKDAAGRAQIGEDLRGRILLQLKDPAIRSQLGPVLGREKSFQGVVGNLPPDLSGLATDLTSYAAFMAGQHPVRGIGALQYFDKVVGGLGQTPEELEGKLSSGHSTAQDVIHQGTPRVQGSTAAGPAHGGAGGAGGLSVTAPDGSVHQFKSQAAADRFKQLAGIK